jgi:hypothetical protein
MQPYSLSHLSDEALDRDLPFHAFQGHANTAVVLAHIAEYDKRRRYLAAGYPSMSAYCTHRLRFAEDSAHKRIRAARTALDFPIIFQAVAKGRLHLTGICQLAPHLTSANGSELLAAAMDKTKSEIEELVRERFPRSELLGLMERHSAAAPECEPAPERVALTERVPNDMNVSEEPAPERVPVPARRSSLAPLAQDRYELRLSMPRSTRDKLRYAQELLSHQIPSGDVAAVFDKALDVLILTLEKRKFAATDRPREPRGSSNPDSRHIPAVVRRNVRKRDGGQCAFVGNTGHRCTSRSFLEFHHVTAFARGGLAT